MKVFVYANGLEVSEGYRRSLTDDLRNELQHWDGISFV